jgi:hypothetical protein
MNENELPNFSMIIHKIAARRSCKIYKYGGVCIPVKDNVLYQAVVLRRVCKKMFEACDIIIRINTIRVCMLGLYSAPIENINHFIEQLNN